MSRPLPPAANRLAPPSGPVGTWTTTTLAQAATMPGQDVLGQWGTTLHRGLTAAEAAGRLQALGPNAIASHRSRPGLVVWHQLRSPLLGLLLLAATASFFVGERSNAAIIVVIVALSVGLGFVNEFRAERAAEALHSQIRHSAVVLRAGQWSSTDVTRLVPGDVVEIRLGDVVPADLRLLETTGLECDESLLTGESVPATKTDEVVRAGTALADLSGCALMGTLVHAGGARGMVVTTGPRTVFGEVAAGLATHQLDTQFQVGLRRFSMLLVYVAAALTVSIFVVNVLLQRPVLDALLFSLAIAVGITPQLLPAVVTTSLAAGSRRMSRQKVLVKRLVCIEDLGDVDLLLTDKTGTLTEGRIHYMRAVPVSGTSSATVLRCGLLATENGDLDRGGAVGGNVLDQALWESPSAAAERHAVAGHRRLATIPFDHQRRLSSVLVQDPSGRRRLVCKGAPEAVLRRCVDVPAAISSALAAEFAAGNRVIAVATRDLGGGAPPGLADESNLTLLGLLVFLDPPKRSAAEALRRLAGLHVAVKVVTGDNAAVATKVCRDLGLDTGEVLTGGDLEAMTDTALAAALPRTTVFARVSPEQKARIVRVQRLAGGGVAFLGDGVNDALALRAADVGISVDSATDVAKDAADAIMLEKDLHVLADGVSEGRRIFANTMKYVLMGTSSNFGNMFSAAVASVFLPFLPMLPSQVLLNNLLYDASQLAIPTDNVDESQLRRPSHWDLRFIRRFMFFFGPLSSMFDFLTFAIMLWVFHAGAAQFRTGWFVESLSTQALIIFAIRTRTVPFFRSHPSLPLTLAALGAVLVGAVLPSTPLAHALGFQALPGAFFVALLGMVLAYLVLIEVGKRVFYTSAEAAPPSAHVYDRVRHLRGRAAYFSTLGRRSSDRGTPAASAGAGDPAGKVVAGAQRLPPDPEPRQHHHE